MPQIVADC